MKLTVDVTGKSDAELTSLAKNDPSKLSVEELLFAATLTNDLSEKAAIYQKVTELYPTDIRGFNNLGAVKYRQGNVDDAARYIAKALAIDNSNVDANFNAGSVAFAKSDLDKAQQYFGKAAGSKGNIAAGLGGISIVNGDYAKAKNYFGSTASNNAALVQILNTDYSGARTTLAAVAQPNHVVWV